MRKRPAPVRANIKTQTIDELRANINQVRDSLEQRNALITRLETETAADRCPLDRGDHRNRGGEEARGLFVEVRRIPRGRRRGPFCATGEVSARTEVATLGAQDDRAAASVGAKELVRVAEAGDELNVEVVGRWPTELDGRDGVLIKLDGYVTERSLPDRCAPVIHRVAGYAVPTA